MAIVYISKEGKSTNNGTMASPYNNITDGLVDNNTIYLRQGNYDFDELSITGKDNIKKSKVIQMKMLYLMVRVISLI